MIYLSTFCHKDQPKVGQYIIHGSYGIGCTLPIFTYASEFARAKDVRLSLLVQVHRRFHVPLSGSCTYRMQLASVLGVVVLFSNHQPPTSSANEMYCLHLSQNHGKGIGTYSSPMEHMGQLKWNSPQGTSSIPFKALGKKPVGLLPAGSVGQVYWHQKSQVFLSLQNPQ